MWLYERDKITKEQFLEISTLINWHQNGHIWSRSFNINYQKRVFTEPIKSFLRFKEYKEIPKLNHLGELIGCYYKGQTSQWESNPSKWRGSATKELLVFPSYISIEGHSTGIAHTSMLLDHGDYPEKSRYVLIVGYKNANQNWFWFCYIWKCRIYCNDDIYFRERLKPDEIFSLLSNLYNEYQLKQI